MSVFEILMLFCFGLAWPFSIYKAITSRSTKGKSLPFLLVIILGYIAGMLHKIFFHLDYVIFVYLINMIMVTVDTVLYLRNRRAEINE